MHDIFDHAVGKAARTLADFHVKRMVLSPTHWKKCQLPLTLKWQVVPFSEDKANDLPNDTKGIYSFILQPGIADHPACSYLLYVGQTTRQDFRTRYRQYLRDLKAGEESRRPHITEMLEKWHEYLWFCYAPIPKEDMITPVEDALLAAYLPPSNKTFPAEINRSLRKLFAV